MLATCVICECSICRYEINTWNEPCPSCGSEILRILHLGFFGKPNHEYRKNVVTGEMLDPDPCEEERRKYLEWDDD